VAAELGEALELGQGWSVNSVDTLAQRAVDVQPARVIAFGKFTKVDVSHRQSSDVIRHPCDEAHSSWHLDVAG
jgi:hypothetical protein